LVDRIPIKTPIAFCENADRLGMKTAIRFRVKLLIAYDKNPQLYKAGHHSLPANAGASALSLDSSVSTRDQCSQRIAAEFQFP
jgi:hypothetical protein